MTGTSAAGMASLPHPTAVPCPFKLPGMNTRTLALPGHPTQPADFPRRVLLAVSGLTPQIVTETLYALAADEFAPFVPTEVHLITSAEGARRAELSLLSDDLGWFHKLCADYHLPGVSFNRSHIHVMRDAQGQPMNDIRSPADNRAAADFITAQVRAITADSGCALHASIAGGRKTMGFYLGYALSLFGRPQDRLSHVLVSEPFESSYDFFYPTPYSRVLQTRDGQLADTALAQVTLAEIPFVSLRHGLPSALLAVFARQTLAGKEPLSAPSKGAPDEIWAKRYLSEYRRITGNQADIEGTERALKHGMDGEYFSARKSKLEKRLKTALGAAAQAYRIHDGGTRPRRYALTLPPSAVRFCQESSAGR